MSLWFTQLKECDWIQTGGYLHDGVNQIGLLGCECYPIWAALRLDTIM